MSFFDKVKKSVSDAATSAGTGVVQSTAIKKAEMELSDLINRYDECHIIIGKRIAEAIRNGDEVSDDKVMEAFGRIQKFDLKKAELEAKIRELKSDATSMDEAKRLAAIESEVEREIAKAKELFEIGVDTQEEYDRKVAGLRNRVTHFKQLDALDKAFAKKLITEEEFKKKRSNLLGRDIVE
jgi:hypothetical protein